MNFNQLRMKRQLKEFESFLGKRVSIMHNGEQRIGVLHFVGPNKFLNIDVQVNIGKSMLRNPDLNSLKLSPLKKPLF